MKIIERLREQLRQGTGAIPWDFGFARDGSGHIDNPGLVRLFKDEELLAISKHNPFLNDRDRELRKVLRATGFQLQLLSQLSGLSLSQLKRITGPGATRSQHRRRGKRH